MNWLTVLRVKRGFTIEELARKIKVPDQTIRKIEKTGGCRVATLTKLKQVLGVDWNDLGSCLDVDVDILRKEKRK